MREYDARASPRRIMVEHRNLCWDSYSQVIGFLGIFAFILEENIIGVLIQSLNWKVQANFVICWHYNLTRVANAHGNADKYIYWTPQVHVWWLLLEVTIASIMTRLLVVVVVVVVVVGLVVVVLVLVEVDGVDLVVVDVEVVPTLKLNKNNRIMLLTVGDMIRLSLSPEFTDVSFCYERLWMKYPPCSNYQQRIFQRKVRKKLPLSGQDW